MSKTKKIVFTVLLGALVVFGLILFFREIYNVILAIKDISIDESQSFGIEGFKYYFVFNFDKAAGYGLSGIMSYNINYKILQSIYCLFTTIILLIVMFFLLKNGTSILWKKTKFSIEEWQKEKQQKEKKKIEAKINKIETKRKDLEKRL